VIAVRGNNDHGAWAERLRESELFQVGDAFIYAIHDVAAIDIEPPRPASRWSSPGIRTSLRYGATTASSTSIPAAPAAPVQAADLGRRADDRRSLGRGANRRARDLGAPASHREPQP
jgi:hypothetical protein